MEVYQVLRTPCHYHIISECAVGSTGNFLGLLPYLSMTMAGVWDAMMGRRISRRGRIL